MGKMDVLKVLKKRSKDYQDGYEAGRRLGVQQATKATMILFVKFLGDRRGWKRETIFDAILRIQSGAGEILGGERSFEEISREVLGKYGIQYVDGKLTLLADQEWKEGSK